MDKSHGGCIQERGQRGGEWKGSCTHYWSDNNHVCSSWRLLADVCGRHAALIHAEWKEETSVYSPQLSFTTSIRTLHYHYFWEICSTALLHINICVYVTYDAGVFGIKAINRYDWPDCVPKKPCKPATLKHTLNKYFISDLFIIIILCKLWAKSTSSWTSRSLLCSPGNIPDKTDLGQ